MRSTRGASRRLSNRAATLTASSSSRAFDAGTAVECGAVETEDRKSTRLNSSHSSISYAVFCLKKKNKLSTVITTNLLLDEIEARIRSRLSDPDLVSAVRISAPDYRRPMEDTSHPELSSLDLLANKTFGTFEERLGEKLPPEESKSFFFFLDTAPSEIYTLSLHDALPI